MAGYGGRDFTPGQRLLTEARIIWHYLSLIVLPLPSRLNIAYDYPLSTGLLAPPQTLFALLGLAALAAAMVFFYPRQRLAAFAIFWYLVNLAVESSIIPLLLIFEHRLYLPATMVLLAVVHWIYHRGRANLALVRGGGLAVLLLLSLFTWQRNQVWQSELHLWQDVVGKSPNLSWVHVNLGKVHAQQRDFAAAEGYFRKALALDPEGGLAYLNLGVLYEQQNRLAEASAMLTQALTKKVGDHGLLLSNLALVELKRGRTREAAAYAEQAIGKEPNLYKPYDILAVAALKDDDVRRAQAVLKKALVLFPGRGEVYARLASVYEKQDRLAEADALLQQALARKVSNPAQVYNQLAIVRWRQQRYPESIQAAQEAIRLDPGLLDAYLTLGITYEDSGQEDLALAQFSAAWQRGLDMAGIYGNWAAGHLQNGNPDRAIVYLREAARLEPGRAGIHQLLAEAYAIKGMSAEAAQEKELARRLGGGDTDGPGRGGSR